MVSQFYKRNSKRILILAGLLFPFLYYHGETLPSNNDIETWIPSDSDVRRDYDSFKLDFGGEEVILIGISGDDTEPRLVESLRQRISLLDGIRTCWSPSRFREVMRELTVDDAEIDQRLRGLVVSKDGNLQGLIAVLSPEGLQDRVATVANVREQVEYCQLHDDQVHVAGGPVVVAELDRLGNRKNNKRFFILTLLISLLLLVITVKHWSLSFAILGSTIWAINLTLTLVKFSGMEMNFILSALPVMVMVFTLAVAIHFVHYVRDCSDKPEPLDAAWRLAARPCLLATFTTAIGLASLHFNEMAPVRHFGYAAAMGSFVALLTGLGLTPAILTLLPLQKSQRGQHSVEWFVRVANWLLDHPKRVAFSSLGMITACGIGLVWLDSHIDPLDFLPVHGKVRQDVELVERDLTNSSSIEAVVDFGTSTQPFFERLQVVRDIQCRLENHEAVRHAISVGDFLPSEFDGGAMETMSTLRNAQKNTGNSDYVAEGQRLWRISTRLTPNHTQTREEVLADLVALTTDVPVTFTGITPLLDRAQSAIFTGFWESFSWAFVIITAVMIVALRSLGIGLVAMIPNLTPILIVFGLLGWLEIPIDIGMTMTGSIALGLAVDGTFHFLVRYQQSVKLKRDSAVAARRALLQTGEPIFFAAVITGCGMLALMFSEFAPTARFGALMFSMLMAAVVGDLILLPVLLQMLPAKMFTGIADTTWLQRIAERWSPSPHFLLRRRARRSLEPLERPSAGSTI